jgi:hypothetical protein
MPHKTIPPVLLELDLFLCAVDRDLWSLIFQRMPHRSHYLRESVEKKVGTMHDADVGLH